MVKCFWRPLFGKLLLAGFGLTWGFSSPALAQKGSQCAQLYTYRAGLSPVVARNFFETGRGLNDYISGLHPDFANQLFSLGPHQVWMDLGAGKGRAAKDYLRLAGSQEQKAQAVLVAYKIDRWFGLSDFGGKLKVYEGRLFEDIPSGALPKVQIITDFFGVLSYTRDLSRSLELALDRLEIGGSLYLHYSHPSLMIESGGRPQSLQTFLSSLEGLLIEGRPGRLKIIKLQDQVQVPSLELTQLDERPRPPFRRFRQVTGGN